MRRFSTAAAAAILLFTATGFADDTKGINGCSTTGQSSHLGLMGLTCVSCGVQMYYSANGKGEVNPSEKWLAILASGARSFRQLNAGEKGSKAESIARNDIAKKNMQSVVISQIQAYNFCTKKYEVNWPFVKKFITNDRNTSEDAQNDLAKSLGFTQGRLTMGNKARDAFLNLVEDSVYTNGGSNRASMLDRRRAFREKASELISREDVNGELRDCLNEMKTRASQDKLTDNQSYDLCLSMANACELETDFCQNGLVLTAKPGSGASSGGSQQNPKPNPVSSQQPAGGRLDPPPPAYVQ